MALHSLLISSFVFTSLVSAAPADGLDARQATIANLTAAQVSSFTPYTFFASAAYCNPSTTLTWSCGSNCAANPDFIPTASGGDGAIEQFWYVGFSPSLQTVVVGHQGTDVDKIVPILEDAAFVPTPLNPFLFPGLSPTIEAHSGFQTTFALSAMSVLAAVNKTIVAHNAKKVTIVGHSLGGAIALLDSVFLPLQFPGTIFKTVTYGMPRVGNPAFANYVDAHPTNLSRITNKRDIVPIIPGRSLGFAHPSGELHIQDSLQWAICPGQDNTAKQCIIGYVPNIAAGNASDHTGPYAGIEIGC